MDLLAAILVFFGVITPNQSGLQTDQVFELINANQSVVEYYTQNPDQLQAINPSLIIDRLED